MSDDSALAISPWALTVVRPLSELDDSALVSAAAAGNREAFDVLVERHRRTVYQVCYRFVNNHEDASDLAQDAFVRAWRGLKNFKGQSALSTWLYRIAVNVCLNRVSAKTPVTEAIESTDHFEDARIEGAQHAMIREERAVAVRRAIAGLPKKQRATLILRTYHDMSHQQIADVLGSSVGAVKANFFHALVNLKKILGIGTMTHLTPDELIDAMEGLLSEALQSHLAACEHCQRELAGLSSALTEAKQVSVPEPSPLFWPNFSQRVRAAIDQDAITATNWRAWLRWQVLLPLGAVAMIILGLMISVPKQEGNDDASVSAALRAPVAPEAPEALDRRVMLADLVGDIDLDTASAAGVTLMPGDAEQAVLQLTAEEQQELTRLLKAELTRAKS